MGTLTTIVTPGPGFVVNVDDPIGILSWSGDASLDLSTARFGDTVAALVIDVRNVEDGAPVDSVRVGIELTLGDVRELVHSLGLVITEAIRS